MVSGGIIIVDDIKNNHAWDGAYQAFNEFVNSNSYNYRIIGTKCGIINFNDKKIVIVSNEKFYDSDGNFSCDNIAEKSLPDELKKNFKLEIIGRKSKFKRAHNLETKKKIETCSNIFLYSKIFDEKKIIILSIWFYLYLPLHFYQFLY